MPFPKRKNHTEPPARYLVIVGSTNPVKVQSTEEAFQLAFGSGSVVQGINVDSGVGKQPIGDEETYRGALGRASNAQVAFPEADFWVGIEGGAHRVEDDWMAYAHIVILDKAGQTGKARSASFYLPQTVGDLLAEGMELGEADDLLFRTDDSKRGSGAVGLLTKGVVDRKALYKQGVSLGLIPFVNGGLFVGNNG